MFCNLYVERQVPGQRIQPYCMGAHCYDYDLYAFLWSRASVVSVASWMGCNVSGLDQLHHVSQKVFADVFPNLTLFKLILHGWSTLYSDKKLHS